MYIKDFDPYDFSKKEINGVPVYYKHLPWAPCIHIRIVCKAGSFSDPIGKEGLAHFLEHVLSDGSPAFADRKVLKEFSKLYMLDSRNAVTGPHRTAAIGKCLPEHFEKVFSNLVVYFSEPFIRTKDVEDEGKIITQEAWGRFKNEKFLAYIQEVYKNIFPYHQTSRVPSALGFPETIQLITPEDIKTFHKENYVKENLMIFLAGNVSEEQLSIVENSLARVPSGIAKTIPFGTIDKPLVHRIEKTSEEIGDPREQAEYTLCRVQPRFDSSQDAIASQARGLLADLLHERLRIEHALCYGVSTSWSTSPDFYQSEISVKLDKEKLALAEQEISNVINEIVSGKWTDRFMTIHNLTIDRIRSQERLTDTIIEGALYDIITDGRITSLSQVIKEAEAVTDEQVRSLIQKTFDPTYTFTEIILPSKK